MDLSTKQENIMLRITEIIPLVSPEELDKLLVMNFKWHHGPYQGNHERYYCAELRTDKWVVEKWTYTSKLEPDVVGGLWFTIESLEKVTEDEISYLALHDKDNSREFFEELKKQWPNSYEIYTQRRNKET